MIELAIDSRLRLQAALLSAPLLKALQDEFTHSNPAWYKSKAMGYWPGKGEPQLIKMWRLESGELTLPRGGIARVRSILEEHSVDHDEVDRRTLGNGKLRPYTGDWVTPQILPPHRVQLWKHQERIVQAVEQHPQVLVRANTGCIAGDAMIGINRAGKGGAIRLDRLVKMHNGGRQSNRAWDRSIPTAVRARMDDGTVRLVRLVDAYESGTKPVFFVKMASGQSVRATREHRFLTADGWKRLEDLSLTDEVYVEPSKRPPKQGAGSKLQYRMVRVPNHPYAGRGGTSKGKASNQAVPLHRLIAEARLSGLSVAEFVRTCSEGYTAGLVFLDPANTVVHHVDGFERNNDPENLVVLTHAQHRKVHEADAMRNIAVRTKLSRVVSIEAAGNCLTYDLQLEAPHNFIANGIVVHNSGKTTALLAAIARLQVPAIVIVWDSRLLEQWQQRIVTELGIPVKEQGLVQGKTCRLTPLTLAMQQTLYRMSEGDRDKLAANFGFVGLDEVARYGAASYTDTLNSFAAKYRVGVGADERRKDGKHFLIRDQLGDRVVEVTAEETIAAGHTVDVAVHMVPTEFDAPWYREAQEKLRLSEDEDEKEHPDFGKLIDEMVANEDRNRLIAEFVAARVQEGRRFFVFTHRLEHARMLDSMLTGLGVRSGRMVGGDDARDEFNATKVALAAGTKQVGVGTYQAIGVGQDVPAVDAGFATTTIHRNRQTVLQLRGRLSRNIQGKQGATLYYAYDRRLYGAAPLRAMIKQAKDVRVWDDETPGLVIPAKDFLNERRAYEAQRSGDDDGAFTTAESWRRKRRAASGGRK